MKKIEVFYIVFAICLLVSFFGLLIKFDNDRTNLVLKKNEKIVDVSEKFLTLLKSSYEVDTIKGQVDSPSVVIDVEMTEFLIKVREYKTPVYYNWHLSQGFGFIQAGNFYTFYVFNESMTIAYTFAISRENVDDVDIDIGK
jgi:hypothetical protein